MTYLGVDTSILEELGAYHTAREIEQQPELWLEIFGMVQQRQEEISAYVKEVYPHIDQIILTGAGSSGFLAKPLEGLFFKSTGIPTKVVLTTDLVTHPQDYFGVEDGVLMISFARSGNSPESSAAVRLAEQLVQHCYHIMITCNHSGELAKTTTRRPKLLLTLPSRANDVSLAMTSSFTGMLFTGVLLARIDELSMMKDQVRLMTEYGTAILRQHGTLQSVAALDFKRAVFLGAGPLFGIAMESDLKLQELTAGGIICKHDSFLGFRHGPKVVIDEHTLVVYLFSPATYVHQYEEDLVRSMDRGKKALFELGVSQDGSIGAQLDQLITFSGIQEPLEEIFWAIVAVLPGQMLGFFKSLELELQPDSPSADGVISRVVQGVSIYPLLIPA
jgi:tagatose-6-phosphate ketose/aldose isomerase